MDVRRSRHRYLWQSLETLESFYLEVEGREDFWSELANWGESEKIQALNQLLKKYPDYDPKKLLQAINIVHENRGIRHQNERYYGNPLDAAFDLLATRRPFETIVAGLIAGSISPLTGQPREYLRALKRVEEFFGQKTKQIVDDAAKLAFDHRPALSDQLEAKMVASRKDYCIHMEVERGKKRLHDTMEFARVAKEKKEGRVYQPNFYSISKRDPLRQKWIENYAGMIRAKNYVPEAVDIRLSERTVLLRKIDPENPTPDQKAALIESYEVHSLMALRRGVRSFTEWVGDLYVRAVHPEAYNAISAFQSNLLVAFQYFQNPIQRAENRVLERLEQLGLKRADDPVMVGRGGGDFFFGKREKSIFSIWRKLYDDGIDPLEYISELTEEARVGSPQRAKIFYDKVLKDNIFDLFGWRIVVDTHVLLEKRLIDEVKARPPENASMAAETKSQAAAKAWRKTERDACYYINELIDNLSASPDYSRPGALCAQPDRDRDYLKKPKDNNYRSFHKGLALAIDIPALNLHRVKIPIELQIRTSDIHEAAEYGDSAWVRFREQGNADNYGWHPAANEVTGDVYAVTPVGNILHLGHGARVLDFASHLGVSMMLACKGAVVRSGYKTSHPLDNFSDDSADSLKPEDPLPNGVTVHLVKHDWARTPEPDLDRVKQEVQERIMVDPSNQNYIGRHVHSKHAKDGLTEFKRRMRNNPEHALKGLNFSKKSL